MDELINNEFGMEFKKLYRLEIIVSAEHESFIVSIIDDSKIKGFTLIKNISGLGHHGFHEGHLLYNDKSTQIMFIVVATKESILQLTKSLKVFFEKHSGVMFVNPVLVSRPEYF